MFATCPLYLRLRKNCGVAGEKAKKVNYLATKTV
jgi:hypothetical protein